MIYRNFLTLVYVQGGSHVGENMEKSPENLRETQESFSGENLGGKSRAQRPEVALLYQQNWN